VDKIYNAFHKNEKVTLIYKWLLSLLDNMNEGKRWLPQNFRAGSEVNLPYMGTKGISKHLRVAAFVCGLVEIYAYTMSNLTICIFRSHIAERELGVLQRRVLRR
jgi:hypothetical protein